tara:strand:+ start:1660 stop:2058 length:399 start_codon:yes stop_codon:yes gene_type:complete
MKKSTNNWEVLENIVLNVNSISLDYTKNQEVLNFNCSFDNIAKGRCKLLIEYKKKKNEIFIFSDKAIMEANLSVSKEIFSKLIYYFNSSLNRKKQIKLILSEGLLINKDGYLYIKENQKVLILDYKFSFPLG